MNIYLSKYWFRLFVSQRNKKNVNIMPCSTLMTLNWIIIAHSVWGIINIMPRYTTGCFLIYIYIYMRVSSTCQPNINMNDRHRQYWGQVWNINHSYKYTLNAIHSFLCKLCIPQSRHRVIAHLINVCFEEVWPFKLRGHANKTSACRLLWSGFSEYIHICVCMYMHIYIHI